MSLIYQQLSALLSELEGEMRQQGLWEAEPPTPEALGSDQPFAVDTLRFSQWLQFVFIARLRALVDNRALLPGSCAVRPMAEESLKGLSQDTAQIEHLLGEVDALLTTPGTKH